MSGPVVSLHEYKAKLADNSSSHPRVTDMMKGKRSIALVEIGVKGEQEVLFLLKVVQKRITIGLL